MTGVWPPSGHLWRAPTSIRLQSRSRFFAKGYLWPRGTASFARALSPKRCELPRASLPGPGQSDFGRIDISTVKDALGSMQWDVDHRADADALQAAVLRVRRFLPAIFFGETPSQKNHPKKTPSGKCVVFFLPPPISHHVHAQASGKIASRKIVCSCERVRQFLPAFFFR